MQVGGAIAEQTSEQATAHRNTLGYDLQEATVFLVHEESILFVTEEHFLFVQTTYHFLVQVGNAINVQAHAFDYLDAPIVKINTADTPAPYSPVLLEEWLPNHKDVVNAVKKVLYK